MWKPVSTADPLRAGDHANMRTKPGNDATVVTVVPTGGHVGVIGCDAWCEVVFEGERGFVHRSLIAGVSERSLVNASAGGRHIAAGTPLISADGAQIGITRGRAIDAIGQTFVVVDLSHGLGAAVPSIRLRAEHVVVADQKTRINITRAGFVKSLPGRSGAEASEGQDAN